MQIASHSLRRATLAKQASSAARAVVLLAMVASELVHATTGTEFQAAATQGNGWLTGYGGKAAAIFATLMGVFMAIFAKNFILTLSGIAIAIAVPIVMGVINVSFGSLI